MQRAADAHRCDGGDVLAVIIHNEELERRCGVTAWRSVTVAIARKRDLPSGDGARPKIHNAITEPVILRRWIHRIIGEPIACACVGRELLKREPLDRPRAEMN